MEQTKGNTTGGVSDSCCSRGGGHENNVNSDCAMSDCESDCSHFEETPAMAPAAADSTTSSGNRVMLGDGHILDGAKALTRDEVRARRALGVRKLMKVYRSQYWGLLEEMRKKYRVFYLRHGKGGWRDDAEEREGADGGGGAAGGGDCMKEPGGNSENTHCGAQGCTAKPIPLSVFCVAHILQEPRQQLYKPCSQVIREGVTCGKPVLRAVVPSLCVLHFHQAEKQATRSLNKVLQGGVKFNPKVHLIVSQYVRIIQSKRRSHRPAALAKIPATAVKVEANGKGVLSSQEGGPPQSNGKGSLSSKEGEPPRSNGEAVLSSQEGGPPRSNGKEILSSKERGPPRSNGKGTLSSKEGGPPRSNGSNGKGILSSKEGGPPRSNGKGTLSSKEGGPPRSNGSNGKAVLSSLEGGPSRSNGKGVLSSKEEGTPRSNGKGVLSSKEGGPPRSNVKGVLSSQEGGPSRSSSAGKGATKAAVHNDEKKPLANGQSKGNNGVVKSKGSNGVKLAT